MKSLYKICAGHSLFPEALHFELHDDPIDVELCQGGFADVSKREHRGQEVAVKVLRVRKGNSLQVMANVGHWQPLFPCTCRLTERNVYRGSARRS